MVKLSQGYCEAGKPFVHICDKKVRYFAVCKESLQTDLFLAPMNQAGESVGSTG